MPPQAFDPANTNSNMNMNQQAHMYSYSAYAPPAYHGHTGYTQAAFAPPGCPPNVNAAMGWTAYYQQAPPQGPPGAQPVQQQQQQQAAAPAQETYEVILPHHHDVLMGRGGKNNQHAGNEKLRDMARDVRERYKASAKKGKSNMSRELVQKVRELDPPGRFLKRNPVTSEWEDVGDEIAREKVSQVLRDAVSEWTGPKSQAKAAAAPTKTATKRSSPSASRDNSPAPRAPPRRVSAAGVRSRSTSPSKAVTASTAEPSIVAAAPAAPLPVIAVPGIATRAVTVTETPEAPDAAVAKAPTTTTAPLKDEPKQPTASKEEVSALPLPSNVPMRARCNTADSEISYDDMDPIAGLDLPGDLEDDSVLNDDTLSLDDSASQAASVTSSGRRGNFRRMQPVGHVPFTSFRTKARNRLDRYSNMSLGVSSSDMSISSQLSSRNLGTQLSGRQLVSTGTRQMSSRQLSSRQLSSRQLSSRQLSSRQLSSRQLSSRQLSSRQLSSRQLSRRGLLSSNMMGESELSLDSLNISGHSKQLSRKNVFMQQYVDMDMGLSDFSVGSFLADGPGGGIAGGEEDNTNAFHESRVSVIMEGDMEEFSEHSTAHAADPIEIKASQLLDMYSATGVGTSFSNMTIGTFSGHSRMSRGISSRGLYSTGNSMRLESGHSFVGNDLQLDMLDDELFDEYDYMDDQDEFSSEFC